MRPTRTILLTALVASAGCGDDDGVRRVLARGKTTLDGRPMAGARIAFMPEAANRNGIPGAAVADAEGAYDLVYRDRHGIAPGTYLSRSSKRAGQSARPAVS
jgi:hypothetical protein